MTGNDDGVNIFIVIGKKKKNGFKNPKKANQAKDREKNVLFRKLDHRLNNPSSIFLTFHNSGVRVG